MVKVKKKSSHSSSFSSVTPFSPPAKRPHRPPIAKMGVITGLAALSLDAVSSVAYGPETVVRSLQEGHASPKLTMVVTLAIVALLAILIVSYRQVIMVFPNGGGSYAVAKKFFGRKEALIAASSLIVDYILSVPVAISAGIAAAWSAFPILKSHSVALALLALLIIMAVNLRGIVTGAQVFIAPTVIFLSALIIVGIMGVYHAPVSDPSINAAASLHTVGILVLIKSFANGCCALTGIEAIANAVPEFKEPKAKNAATAECALGAIIAFLLLGIAYLINVLNVTANGQETILSQIVSHTLGEGLAHNIFQIITIIMLVLAANTSFGGLPNLMNLLAEDDYLPHRLAARTKAGVYKDGVIVLAVASGALLVLFHARVESLVPLYSIGVFVGFSIAQAGLVIHWWKERPFAWAIKLIINACGAIATTIACVVVIAVKFKDHAWLVFVAMIILVAGMNYMAKKYEEQDIVLNDFDAITAPLPEVSKPTMVLVPVASVSMLARKAIVAAMSMGKTMVAVHVLESFENADQFEVAWNSVFPMIELVLLHADEDTSRASALTDYVIDMEALYQVVVIVADAAPPRGWRAILPSRQANQLMTSLDENTNAVVARVIVKGLEKR